VPTGNRLVQEALAARRFSIDITALESIVGLCDPNSSRSASRRASLALSPAEADALFLPSLPPVASAIAQALEAATAPLVIKQEASFPVPAPPRATLTKKRAAPSRYSDGDDDDDDDDDVYERSSKRRAADPKPVVSIPLSSVHVSGTRIGVYTVEERQLRIQRFLEKRQRRVWRKRIKYDCRKVRVCALRMRPRSRCRRYIGGGVSRCLTSPRPPRSFPNRSLPITALASRAALSSGARRRALSSMTRRWGRVSWRSWRTSLAEGLLVCVEGAV
jgi:hypothetical protein